MSHRISYNIVGHAHFLTFSCWHRQPFLSDPRACLSLVKALEEARQTEQLTIWAYVFMPEHVHLLIRPRLESYNMANILRRIKEPTARHMLHTWRENNADWLAAAVDLTAGRVTHRFWQPGGGFDRNVSDPEKVRKAIDYIEWNPVRRGLVTDPMHWEWSSAQARGGREDVPLRIDDMICVGNFIIIQYSVLTDQGQWHELVRATRPSAAYLLS